MALTLRRTRIEPQDWDVLDDGKPVGRIYERHAPGNPDLAWFWSITAYVEPRAGLRISGMTEKFDAANAAFRATWEQWQSWAAKTGFNSSAG
jgi:hypothetical protein